MRARVTPDELKAGALVNPTWYLMKISRYEEKPGKSDPSSTTAWISLTVVCDSKGDEKFKGSRSMLFINEKSTMIAPYPSFYVALGAAVDPKTGIDANLDDKIVSRYVEAFLVRTKDDNGKEQNTAQEFAKPGTNFKADVLAKYAAAPVA
jgi:hypothetical protein